MDVVRNTVGLFPGTSISSIGYGTDHNVELIQQLSAVGGGSYYVVNNLDDIATVFGDVLGGLASCTLQQIRVILPPKCELRTRYAVKADKTGTEVTIGDLPAGASAVFLARVPVHTALTVKGFNLANMYEFDIAAHVVPMDDEEHQINGEAHYLRFEVLGLLDRAKELRAPSAEIEGSHVESEVQGVIALLRAQIQNITEYRQQHPHSLWDVLVDELQSAKRYLERRRHVAADTSRIMSQHSSFLGRMRGIAASSTDPNEAPAHPVLQSAFSNSIQRGISSQLHEVVSASQMDAEESAPSSFVSGVPPSTPLRREEEESQPASEPGAAPHAPLRLSRQSSVYRS